MTQTQLLWVITASRGVRAAPLIRVRPWLIGGEGAVSTSSQPVTLIPPLTAAVDHSANGQSAAVY